MKLHTRNTVEFEFDSWTITTADEPVRRTSVPDDAPGSLRGGGRRRRSRAPIAIVGVALAVVVGAAVVLDDEDAPPAAEEAGDPAGDRVVPAADPPPGPDLVTLPPAVASPLPYPGARVTPGRYETDLLGIPIDFAVGDPTALRTARPGLVLLTPAGSSPPHLDRDPHVQFVRIAGWNSPEEAVDESFRSVGSIAPDDIEGWIAANDVIVDARSERLVDGRRARVFDLHVDPGSGLGDGVCLPEVRPCFWFASVPGAFVQPAAVRLDYVLYGSMAMRFWLIDIDGELPVLIQVAVPGGGEAWLDEFEATTIDTISLGT